jgi:endonuclease/exonuclease/phosphatase family metal-dependent hydrolase
MLGIDWVIESIGRDRRVALQTASTMGAVHAEGRLRLVTWNVRAAIGPGEFPTTWWRRQDRERLAAMAAVLAALDAEVIGLQECAVLNVDGSCHDTAAEVAAMLGMAHRFAAARHFAIVEDDGRLSGSGLFGNALLSSLEIGPSRMIELPMAPEDALIEPPGADHPLAGVRYTDAPSGVREPRCLLSADLGGRTVGVTHLSHNGSGERALQAAAVDQALRESPSVLLGDLNAPIESDELAVFRDGWTDAFAVAGAAPGDARRITTDTGARIDHVLVRGLEVLTCRRVDEAARLSDHLPVLAEVRVDRPA